MLGEEEQEGHEAAHRALQRHEQHVHAPQRAAAAQTVGREGGHEHGQQGEGQQGGERQGRSGGRLHGEQRQRAGHQGAAATVGSHDGGLLHEALGVERRKALLLERGGGIGFAT